MPQKQMQKTFVNKSFMFIYLQAIADPRTKKFAPVTVDKIHFYGFYLIR